MMKKYLMILGSIFVMGLANSSYCADVYVDAMNGSNENTGTSIDNAWKTITYALDRMVIFSSTIMLHVAPGTYNKELGEVFPLKLIGHAKYIGEDSRATIIDASGSNTHVIELVEVRDLEMSGFTITGGNGAKSTGGGIDIKRTYNYPIVIRDCVIKDNKSLTIGGGIASVYSSPTIMDCTITNNRSSWGGGICIYGSSNPHISHCIITGNKAVYDPNLNNGGEGGSIFCEMGSPTITDCLLTDNTSISGAGMHFCSNSEPFIKDCIIRNNNSLPDGGYQSSAGGLFFVTTNAIVINCLIAQNYADEGGGVFCYDKGKTKLINCTIVDNKSPLYAGVSIREGATPILTNCIIWGNNSVKGRRISYSCIEGGYEGVGNIDKDPLFVTGLWGDFYLSQKDADQDNDSPCISAGSDIPVMGFMPSDYITRTDGVVDTGRIDMGFHYKTHIRFGLSIDPILEKYGDGDSINLKFDIHTAPAEINADVFLIMLDPDGYLYSALLWNQGLQAIVQGLAIPKGLDIKGSLIASFEFPCSKPPIGKPWTYIFYLTALKPGTVDFISNIATARFTVE
jgi:parallel beta-helix repeat protein